MSQTMTISQMAGLARKQGGNDFGNLRKSGASEGPQSYNSFSGKGQDHSGLATLTADMKESGFEPQEDLFSNPASNNADALFNDNSKQSVVSVLNETSNIDFEPNAENIDSNAIDSTKPETDAEGKNKSNNAHIDDAEEKMDQLETFWNDHQAVAQDYLEKAYDNKADQIGLTEKGISKESVVKQIMPQGDTGKGSAAANAIPGVAAADVAASINEQRKDLTRDQKRALIEEMVKIAQERPKLDSNKLGKTLKSGLNLEEIQENLARLSSANMEKLITQRVDQQPEYQALERVHNACMDVRETQLVFARTYDQNITDGKVEALRAARNEVVVSALNDSQVYRFGEDKAKYVGDHIAGSSISAEITTMNANMDMSSVASMFKRSRLELHMGEIQEQLRGYAQKAIV
ncbi:MAG: hypothetical protein OEY94_10730 [Alphaproteobacteria bacterium]|nr:hypothetical protein [Alphaproteobacteria bacterium]